MNHEMMAELIRQYGLYILLIVYGCVHPYNGLQTCADSQFLCPSTNICILKSWKCDGEPDCENGEDESTTLCGIRSCAENEFFCHGTNKCIPKRWTCDGEPDCENGEDEDTTFCESINCGAEEFSCTNDNKTCISITWKCDGAADCVNGTDEMNCLKTCDIKSFTCKDGTCISKKWICDGDNDCPDMSDEVQELCGDKTCSPEEFQCDDLSRCIDMKWKCDGDFDCPDHSDETDNCSREPTKTCLSSTEFACITTGACIHKSWVCDGEMDCTDGSDEGSVCVPKCLDGQFMCDNHHCISGTSRCDGHVDCTDGSDENNCVHDPCLQHTCTNNSHCVNKEYSNKTFETKCECDKGFRWTQDGGICTDIDECEQQGVCSQICTNTQGGYKCDCFPSYSIEKDHFCRANGDRPWLYYASQRNIHKLRIDIKNTTVIMNRTNSSVALDIDYEDGLIFWTDISNHQIMRAKLGGDKTLAQDIKTIISDEKGRKVTSDGLAVDWLYKNIYWTDTRSDTISVADYAGDKSVTLISTGIDEPRAICVDPENGYMYWTDWGEEPKIERCGMDGQDRETIVNAGDGLGWPNGLTIDYIGKRIYWIDSRLHKIGTANMDGSDKGHVIVDSKEIRHPFSISVFEDTLYWTDWTTNSIHSINKFTGKNATIVSTGSDNMMDVKVYHELRQLKDFKEKSKVLCKNALCEYMCLPAARKSGNATVSCVCTDGQNFKKSCMTAQTTQTVPAYSPEPTHEPIPKSSPKLTQNRTNDHDPCLQHTCTNNSHCVNEEYSNKTFEAKCECDKGFRWTQDGDICTDIDECEQQGVCSQICTNTQGGYKCDCFPSYSIEEHHFCRANGDRPWLYYANRRYISKLRIDIKNTTVILYHTNSSVALDIDYEDGLIFWTDVSNYQIMRAKLGDDETIPQDIKTVISDVKGKEVSSDGLAVDWLYKNIYWTDTRSDTISVADYAGDKSITLISTGLDEPRAICVDPENGYMYWTDWGQEPKIERCGMDGQDRETIVNVGDGLGWPNGLTIDYIGKRIYWIDSRLHKIGTANMDGSDKGHVIVDATEIRHPFSISVFEDTLYWTDWLTKSIHSINKFTGKNATILSTGSDSMTDVKVYHELRQLKDFKEKSKVLCKNAHCEYMCLPAARKSDNATVSCVCADNQNFKKSCMTAQTAQTVPTHSSEPTHEPIQTSSPKLTQYTTRKQTLKQQNTENQNVTQMIGTTQMQHIQTSKSSTLGNSCTGNNDCWVIDNFPFCNGTVCRCKEGTCTCGESYKQKNDTCIEKSLHTDSDGHNLDSRGLSDAVIIGVAIGVLVASTLIIFVVIYFMRYRKRSTDSEGEYQNMALKYAAKRSV